MQKIIEVPGVGNVEFPDSMSDADIGTVIKKQHPELLKSNTLLASRQAASKSEFDANRPPENKIENAGLKTVLDAPLDFGIGLEKTFGLDPMHPIASAPAAVVGIGKGLLNAVTSPVETGKGLWRSMSDAITRGGTAIREQNIPEAAQAIGEGYGIAKPAIEAVQAAPGTAVAAAKKLVTPEQFINTATNLRNMPAPANLSRFGAVGVVGAGLAQALGYPWMEGAAVSELADLVRRNPRLREVVASRLEKIATEQVAGQGQGVMNPDANALRAAIVADQSKGPIERPITMVPKDQRGGASNYQPFPDTSGTVYTPPPGSTEQPPNMNLPQEVTLTKPPAVASPEIPMANAPEVTAAPAVNFKAIEEALAPSGKFAKKASQMVDAQGKPTEFGQRLIAEVPELSNARKGPAADAALMTGFGRTLQKIIHAEDAVPRETVVPKAPIIDGLENLKAEYADYGNPRTSVAIDKLIDTWKKMPDQIPWEQFRDAKRAFFNEANTKSGPMRRAYGLLMEASSGVSEDLAAANKSYSTVRRALDNANIDIKTGRRIMDVGKGPKWTMGNIADQSAPKTATPAVDVPSFKPPPPRSQLVPTPTPAPSPLMGQNTSEAMTRAAAGRRPELLKEGKAFDSAALVNSELFGGKGGPQQFLGADVRAEVPALTMADKFNKLGLNLTDPDIARQAHVDMRSFAEDVRNMQSHREYAAGGNIGPKPDGSTGHMPLNYEGKQVAEDAAAEWSKVGKSLGLTPPPGLEKWSPGRIAQAVEKGKGADFMRAKQAFTDAAKDEFLKFHESQRESGVGPSVQRERFLTLMRKSQSKP